MAEPAAKSTDRPPHRLISAQFRSPVSFGGLEIMNATLDLTGARQSTIESITPAVLNAEGLPVPPEKGQSAQGLCIRGIARLAHGPEDMISFIPWANVANTDYRRPKVK